jgi:hypothetical protein
LIQIGQAVAVSTLPLPLLAEQTNPLPPGVFLPSPDHLGHALMVSGRFRIAPPGCPTDYATPFTAPLFLTHEEFSVIRRIAELILGLPETATALDEVAEWIDRKAATAAATRQTAKQQNPLHRALSVAYAGESRTAEFETAAPDQICREGLTWLAKNAGAFLALTHEKQISLLASVSDTRPNTAEENAGTHFFSFLKTESIHGYYTSQAGLKELDFKGNGFYAKSPGCDVKLGNQ